MSDPLDNTPPPEELEMAVEEHFVRPMAGEPSERIRALTARISYLDEQTQLLWHRISRDANRYHEIQGEFNALQEEKEEARRQLGEWRMQLKARN